MIDGPHFSGKLRICLVGISVILGLLLVFIILSTDLVAGEDIVVDDSGGGDYRYLHSAVMNAEEGDVLRVMNGDYSIDDLGGDVPAGTTIIGEDRNRTRLIFNSLFTQFVIFNWNIHFENLNFTSQRGDRSNIIKVFGAGNTFINCSFSNVEVHIEDNRFSKSVANGLTFTDNHFWNSGITFMGPYEHYNIPEFSRKSKIDDLVGSISSYRMENNSFNGLPIHFFTDTDNISLPSLSGGIILIDCHNVSLENLDLPLSSNGIILMDCSNISISTSSILSTSNLLSVWLSTNITLTQSTIGHPDHPLPSPSLLAPGTSSTLVSLYSDFVSFLNCTSYMDIHFEGGRGPVFSDNDLHGSSGFSLSSVNDAVITNNSFEKLGISLHSDPIGWPSTSFRHVLSGNSIGEKDIIYLIDQQEKSISENAGQVFLVNCSGIAVDSLSISSVSQGVLLYDTTESSIINSSFTGNDEDIILHFSHDNLLRGSTFTDSGSTGISIIDGDGNTISDSTFAGSMITLSGEQNTIHNCDLDMQIGTGNTRGILSNGNSLISETTVFGFRYGIHHQTGFLSVLSSEISGNEHGIYLEAETSLRVDFSDIVQNSVNGITSKGSDHMTIIDSLISDNGKIGVELDGTISLLSGCTVGNNGHSGVFVTGNNGVISNCLIENNSEAGIKIELAPYLTILNNSILNNGAGIVVTSGESYLIANCTILNNEQDGVKTTDGSYGTIENTTISGSKNGFNLIYTTADIRWCSITSNSNGIYAFRPVTTVNVTNSVIRDNSEFGISTPDFNAFKVIARYNYWGSRSGPSNSDSNPDGRGDSIGTEIDFSPWFTDDQFSNTDQLVVKGDEEDDENDLTVILATSLALLLPIIIGMGRFRKRRSHLLDSESTPLSKEPRAPRTPKPPKEPPRMKHFEEEIEYPSGMRMASINARIVASIIDGILLFVIFTIIFLFLILEIESVDNFLVLYLAVYILVPIEYFLFIEGYSGQAIGKNMAGIKLVYQKEGPISFGRAIRSGVIKGFLYPFGSILDGVFGVFMIHQKSRQRLSQHNAELVVVALRKRSSGNDGERPVWDHGDDSSANHRWNQSSGSKEQGKKRSHELK